MKEYIIVGAGLSGGVLARKLADAGNVVKIYEKRNHLSGNMYDYVWENVLIQKYGPHVFHTNNDDVFQFISQYCNVIPYRTKCEAVIDGISTPSPFNFKTIDQFFPERDAAKLKKKLLDYYPGEKSVTVVEMLESKDSDIRNYASFLFEKDYKLYTAKQWGVNPSEIDTSVLKRVPILLSYRDTYFDDKYEFMPEGGFCKFYERLIASDYISVFTEIDALKHISFFDNKILFDGREQIIIYTGAIDELFGYCFGELPYRSLEFEFKSIESKSYQNRAIVAYPQELEYTRVTEFTKMPEQDKNKTVVAYEYPRIFSASSENTYERYYPILTDASMELYDKYKSFAKQYDNLILCGRLADFKYYNMDQVIERALNVAETLL